MDKYKQTCGSIETKLNQNVNSQPRKFVTAYRRCYKRVVSLSLDLESFRSNFGCAQWARNNDTLLERKVRQITVTSSTLDVTLE